MIEFNEDHQRVWVCVKQFEKNQAYKNELKVVSKTLYT